MMSPQCSTCGTYFTGNETFCARCGAARVANSYQDSYQTPYGQPVQQQANGGNFFQRYYSPQRVVKRIIIGRLIGIGVVLVIFGGCIVCVLLGGLASVLGSR
jgi:hypothetical protein